MAFWNECRHSLSSSSAPHVTAAMLHLIQAALVAVPPAAHTARDAQINKYFRAIGFIEARLCEQSLSASTIAAACNISPRHLHRMFAESDETVSGYISRRRLEECAALLQSPLHRRRTFSSIAADCGFQTLTGFGKAFRHRYGMTLSEYRRQSSASGHMPQPRPSP
jgi:AraC-like DNA-binding protein